MCFCHCPIKGIVQCPNTAPLMSQCFFLMKGTLRRQILKSENNCSCCAYLDIRIKECDYKYGKLAFIPLCVETTGYLPNCLLNTYGKHRVNGRYCYIYCDSGRQNFVSQSHFGDAPLSQRR